MIAGQREELIRRLKKNEGMSLEWERILSSTHDVEQFSNQ